MTWDEQTYGREYDLDIFNIVAVDDFNMGAMENKGLNIFNSSCVLASPETSTDADFERIEAIIAHEYFHNWTGNRITCRDWFQLCLKEGLTVYRDQQFTSDMRSAPVKRIDDAITLRAAQFREDAGPLAHPPRPSSFSEINNFYTSTVYEKGAEIIGMLHTLAGDAVYKAALDLYFDRHDGDAATIENFRACFEAVMDTDLTQFARWWTDPGTPHVTVTEDWNDNGTLTIHLAQTIRAAGRDDWPARVIPLRYALIGRDGCKVQAEQLFVLDASGASITVTGLADRPILSINRGFTAPIILTQPLSNADRAILLGHDSDPFNRWDAGRVLVSELLCRMVTDGTPPDTAYLDAMLTAVRDNTLDPAFRAFLLSFPSQGETAQSLHSAGHVPDPDAIHLAHQTLKHALALHLQDHLASLYAAMSVSGPYSPDAISAGKRSLANAILGLLTRVDAGKQATALFETADNMTQQIGALSALLWNGHGEKASADFAAQWRDDRLVMDKWFGLQVALSAPENTVAIVKKLSQHPDFNLKNPNRFRAVFGAFSRHAAGFHRADGSGYELLADWLIKLDPINPQTTARVVTAFDSFRRYDTDRQAKMRAALDRIAATPNLSRDTMEMVTRILASG
ncbi:aminopeptidase N [Loktanella ponticola]|uniref:Aminopeptidase N n=1 Tax=Yoonia ponticola TaxID=1524255 RepID=A0A7W9BLU1_9RHOB|nr:aminopeptidase N [Yoonia ponticola]